jgi:hypothetical protein
VVDHSSIAAKRAPVVGVPVRRQGKGRGADGAQRRGRLDEAPSVGKRAGEARAQQDQQRQRRRSPRRSTPVGGGGSGSIAGKMIWLWRWLWLFSARSPLSIWLVYWRCQPVGGKWFSFGLIFALSTYEEGFRSDIREYKFRCHIYYILIQNQIWILSNRNMKWIFRIWIRIWILARFIHRIITSSNFICRWFYNLAKHVTSRE